MHHAMHFCRRSYRVWIGLVNYGICKFRTAHTATAILPMLTQYSVVRDLAECSFETTANDCRIGVYMQMMVNFFLPPHRGWGRQDVVENIQETSWLRSYTNWAQHTLKESRKVCTSIRGVSANCIHQSVINEHCRRLPSLKQQYW